MSHQPKSRSRSGILTARALRFGLRPGSVEVQAAELARLAHGDVAAIESARHQVAGGTDDPLFLDPVRRHALDLLYAAEAQLHLPHAAA